MNIPATRAIPARLSAAAGMMLAAVLIALDFATWIELNVAVVYSLPLVFAAAAGSRRLLWSMACALVAVTVAVYYVQVPSAQSLLMQPPNRMVDDPYFVDRMLAALTVLLTATILHGWLHSLHALELRDAAIEQKNASLVEVNRELVLHKQAITRQNAELEQSRHAVEEISKRKTEMLASIAHDIRTPLQAITLLAEVMRRMDPATAPGNGRIAHLAKRLQAHALAVSELLAEVMDLAAFDEGQTHVHPGEFLLEALLIEQRQRLLPLAEEKGLKLIVTPGERTLRLCTDKVKLGRVISNLVGNAIKFTREGTINLHSSTGADASVRISVSDTGCGIQPENIERIFGSFAQADATDDRQGAGWGLGLAISRRMIVLLGGELQVSSRPGEGSTFTVILPMAARAPEAA